MDGNWSRATVGTCVSRRGEAASAQRRPGCLPAIISISSTGDYRDPRIFSGRQSVAASVHSLRKYPDAIFGITIGGLQMFFNTTAHMNQFQSHILAREDDEDAKQVLQDCKWSLRTPDVLGSRYVIVEKPGTRIVRLLGDADGARDCSRSQHHLHARLSQRSHQPARGCQETEVAPDVERSVRHTNVTQGVNDGQEGAQTKKGTSKAKKPVSGKKAKRAPAAAVGLDAASPAVRERKYCGESIGCSRSTASLARSPRCTSSPRRPRCSEWPDHALPARFAGSSV